MRLPPEGAANQKSPVVNQRNRTAEDADLRFGFMCALSAYFLWGMVPIYFKLLDHVDAGQVVAHRIVWSVFFVGVFLFVKGRMDEVFAVFKNKRNLAMLTLSAATISLNWYFFVYAVETGRVLAVSLGYFINPLANVAFGMVLLSERQTPLQGLAIAIAAVAVGWQTISIGELPLISLLLAVSFAFYAYLRKQIVVGASPGLFVETLVLLPVALFYLIYSGGSGGPYLGYGASLWPLLIGLGAVTSLPLILFAAGARRLRMTTLGVLQYLAPSLHFFVAIWIFGEPLEMNTLITFVLIWCSLGLFTYGSMRTGASAT
ncbi:MAG: EamA family transporter RarD [Stappiaceae bacterium]